MTAAIGLFKRLALPETSTGKYTDHTTFPILIWHEGGNTTVIINGASSSVGAYAVQLAKRAGMFVIGVAGSSKDYAKSLGADVLIDYREHKGDALVSPTIGSHVLQRTQAGRLC